MDILKMNKKNKFVGSDVLEIQDIEYNNQF